MNTRTSSTRNSHQAWLQMTTNMYFMMAGDLLVCLPYNLWLPFQVTCRNFPEIRPTTRGSYLKTFEDGKIRKENGLPSIFQAT